MKQSVKSSNPRLSSRQACKSVIQTFYDIVKAHGRELSVRTPSEKVETKEARAEDPVGRGEDSEFIVKLPPI